MSLEPRAQLAQFLATLWPQGFLGHWCNFWGLPSKCSQWTQEITDDTLTMLETWGAKENVYLGCTLRAQNFGPTFRGKKSDCVALPGLYLDVDFGREHKKPNLPPTEADAMLLIQEMGPEPTIIVHSGHGLQAWWCFREPWLLDSEDEQDKAERFTESWSATLRMKAKAHGWDADQVGDLARVMRLPGLWNRKGVAKRTSSLRCDPLTRYNPGDFESYLTTESVPVPVQEIKWTFTLDPVNAQPPAEKFALHIDQDFLFRASWFHARTDMQDQSCSAYDMSLATRTFGAQWTVQEIVDLLVAHRRKYKDKTSDPEKIGRRDYYERTLSRAIAGADHETREDSIQQLKAGHALPDSVTHDKAEVFSVISGVLGASITKLLKYQGEVGTYEMEINGKAIRLGGIELLTAQRLFRNKVADVAGIWFAEQTKSTWDHTVRLLLQVVEFVEVGQEGTSKGALAGTLEGYLSLGVAGEDKADESFIQHAPAYRHGAVNFTLSGLRLHLYAQHQERVTTQTLAVQLRAMGYQSETINLIDKRKKIRTQRIIWHKQ